MVKIGEAVRIMPVQGGKELEEFLQLPWQIYQHDPYWVPPLLSHQRHFLDKKHGPFFEIGEAEYFLAYLGGKPVGRISAHINRLYDQHHDRETGFFGFFECIPQPEVAEALIKAAANWLHQHGKMRLVGPLNFSIYDEMGLLVEGFDSMPAIFQTHNPAYYRDYLHDLGFEKVMDWQALRITERNIDIPGWEKLLKSILNRQSLVMTTFRSQDLDKWADDICDLFNEAWAPNWGHVPFTKQQFNTFMKELKPLLRPSLVNLLLDNNRLVAFNVVIPDPNPLIQSFNGRFTLWHKLRLLYAGRFGTIHKVRGLVLGVLRPYQTQRLHHALIMRTYLNIVQQTQCKTCDLSLIPETLGHYIKTLTAFGAEHYKTFRIFEKKC